MAELANRILASFYGLAFGDALGNPLSTLSYSEISSRFPDISLVEFDDSTKKYTVGDDTQTALYIALAIRNAKSDQSYKKEFIRHLLFWFDDPVGNRHASQHLLNALERLRGGIHWTNATNISMNRCDILARSSSIAYWMARDGRQSKYWSLAQLQAALTHAHPTSLMAVSLHVEALVQLLNGMKPELLLNHLISCIPQIENHWDDELMEDLWKSPGYSTPAEFFRNGSEKCLIALETVELHLNCSGSHHLDPSELFGEGWCAHEAMAISLYSFLKYTDRPEMAVKRAVSSNGPSDVLGAVTGTLAGARTGSDGWPADWYTNIEYRDEILELSRIIGRGALI